jgi:hypothetical protein
MKYEPCDREYTWNNIGATAVGGPPAVRYDASAVSINGVIYIFGGTSIRRYSDLWAYVVSENAWKSLTPVSHAYLRACRICCLLSYALN